MKNTIKKVMPMRLVTLVRCVKSHRAEGKMDMILGGLKDFQCQKCVYSHAKDEETAYLEQLEKICRKIEIDENNYFFYPYSKTLHRFFPTHAMNILSITPAYEEVLATDFAAMGENRVVRALKILVDRVTEKQSCVVRFMEVTRLCRRVLYPSDSFEGALQKILFFHAMLWQMEHGHNGLGRLDMALFPYYKKDIEEGRLTREKAEVILREMIALIGSQTHQKSATLYGDTGQYILLGGFDKEGRNVENELTHLFLGIFATLSIPDPKLILRVNNHTSKSVYDATARCLLKGNGSPLILNEDKVIPLMERFGYAPEDCYNLGTSACWEPLILGKSFDQNNNLNSISPLKAVNNAIMMASSYTADFEAFMRLFEQCLEENIRSCAHDLVMDCSPLFTLLFSDATKSGKDISKGGAKYAYHGMLVVGLPNTINALLNIKELVFKQKLLTLKECKDVIEHNFENAADLRGLLQSQPLKFGKVDDSVLRLTNRVSDKIESVVSNIRINGRRAKVGFSSPNYISQAFDIEASMDGRRSGEPLSTHISPVGKNIDIVEVINFASLMNYEGCRINGNVVDFIIPAAFNRHVDKLSELLNDSVQRGLYELQLNVLDKNTLIDARNHPEKYPNLVVRVWGFSAYFNELPDEYKVNLINRAEAYEC